MRVFPPLPAMQGLLLSALVTTLMLPTTHANDDPKWLPPAPAKGSLRIATYNVSLHRSRSGELLQDLQGDSQQAKRLARIIQTVQPDVLLVNEIDFDPDAKAITLFRTKYLNQVSGLASQKGSIPYEYQFAAPVNTGIPSGMDLNANGKTDESEDAFGFGAYPGQYGMAVYSRFAIQTSACRTFQKLLWSSMPNAKQPMKPNDAPYYPSEIWKQLRLSSKSHWDVLIDWNGRPLHLLASHPTPPVFDGPEDRNGCRNHDEIRFWIDYLQAADTPAYIQDDAGKAGGLPADQAFVVCGDLNADPSDGAGIASAIQSLIDHPRMAKASAPTSDGGEEAAATQKGGNQKHRGPAREDTADFTDKSSGNLRCDFVLPSQPFQVVASGIFWPTPSQLAQLDPELIDASDHRLVWVDVRLP